MMIRSEQAGRQLLSAFINADEIHSELRELLVDPNSELPRPLSWVGIYDKSAAPAHLRVGAEGLIMYVSGKVLKALEAERIGIVTRHRMQGFKQPFVRW